MPTPSNRPDDRFDIVQRLRYHAETRFDPAEKFYVHSLFSVHIERLWTAQTVHHSFRLLCHDLRLWRRWLLQPKPRRPQPASEPRSKPRSQTQIQIQIQIQIMVRILMPVFFDHPTCLKTSAATLVRALLKKIFLTYPATLKKKAIGFALGLTKPTCGMTKSLTSIRHCTPPPKPGLPIISIC